jgi:hypothetical protein
MAIWPTETSVLKPLHLAVAMFACTAFIAAPASAKVSIARAQQICEAAAQVLQPTPKSARADRDELQATSAAITIFLRVQTADNAVVKVTCTVDRETSMATLTPSMLTPPTAALTPAP